MATVGQNISISSRCENRVQCPFVAQLRRGAALSQVVTIRDMSPNGLQATCFNAPTEDERVSIRFENGRSVHGVVRWVRKGIFGVEFQAPVNVEIVTENAATHPLRSSVDI